MFNLLALPLLTSPVTLAQQKYTYRHGQVLHLQVEGNAQRYQIELC